MRLFILLLLISTSLFAQLPAENLIKIGSKNFSFYTNKDITKEQSKIERAIITIHGSVRNADTYFKSVWGLSKRLNVENKTIVISPHFKITGDQLKANELYYSYEGWWIGDQSINKPSVSSFSVIDFFITKLANKKHFPNLKTLIITGHSAGGHMTGRLAIGTQADLKINHLDITYVVANPGTYAYLSKKRPVKSQAGVFAIPSSARCSYNRYKYGMDKRNLYMSLASVEAMAARFIQRDVVYFLGEKDIGDVEQTCQAALQGPHRFARGKNYKDHIDEEYPANLHRLISVPNVGHTQYGMYTSDLGIKLLFGL